MKSLSDYARRDIASRYSNHTGTPLERAKRFLRKSLQEQHQILDAEIAGHGGSKGFAARKRWYKYEGTGYVAGIKYGNAYVEYNGDKGFEVGETLEDVKEFFKVVEQAVDSGGLDEALVTATEVVNNMAKKRQSTRRKTGIQL